MENSLTLCTKINSKWIKDLNKRIETTKRLEENVGSTLFDTGLNNIFLAVSPQAREKAMALHSSTLAWKIPWTEEPWGC